MAQFITYFAHPVNPYITVSEEGSDESITVFVREDGDGEISVKGLPPLEEGVDGWETVKASRNGVEYIHNRRPWDVVFDGLNPTTRIASRATVRPAPSKAVHLSIKRAAQPPAETL